MNVVEYLYICVIIYNSSLTIIPGQNSIMNDLLQEEKETLSNDYFFDLDGGFKMYEAKRGDSFYEQEGNLNYLVFLLDGEIVVNYNEYKNIFVEQRNFFMIPKKSELAIKVNLPGSLIAFGFDKFNNIFDKIALKSYSVVAGQIDYAFEILPIRYALNDFLYSLLRYIRNGLDSVQMIDIKRQELFLLIRHFYNKEEIANMFHPILGQSLEFKNQVLQHYQEVNNVDELARKMGLGRTNFDSKFKNEFGISPLQWMLKQKANHVRFSMSEPGSTLSDIMRKYNFSSPTQLNRFCRQQFGCSPRELMKEMQETEIKQPLLAPKM